MQSATRSLLVQRNIFASKASFTVNRYLFRAFFHHSSPRPEKSEYEKARDTLARASRRRKKAEFHNLPTTGIKSRWEDVSPEFVGTTLQVRPANTVVDRSCDEVRRQIHALIDGREFTIVGFCKKIGVSKTAFYRFMRQHGAWKGQTGDTFPSALRFFQEQERMEEANPRKDDVSLATYQDAQATPERKAKRRKPMAKSITDIKLPGEDEDAIPVYSTCDEIRLQINIHLRRPSVDQSQFIRDLSAQFHVRPRRLIYKSLDKFRSAHGPNVGNTSPVFYGAYVFFEKRRIAAGKTKSKHREAMEEIYGAQGGVNVKVPCNRDGTWPPAPAGGPHRFVRLDKYGITTVNEAASECKVYGPKGRPTRTGDNSYEHGDYLYQYI